MDNKVVNSVVIGLLLFVGGCASEAWYNPEISVSQAIRDYQDCDCISYDGDGILIGVYNDGVFTDCMKAEGYYLEKIVELRKDKEIKIKPSPISLPPGFITHGKPIAGKMK